MIPECDLSNWRTEYATQGCGVILTALMVLPELAVMNPVMGPLILIVKGMRTDVSNFCQLYVALVVTFAVAFTGIFANIPQVEKRTLTITLTIALIPA